MHRNTDDPIATHPTIAATDVRVPPNWAVMQRQLISLIEDAAELAARKYSRPDGSSYHENDIDDVYESRSYRGSFYAIGGSDRMLEIAYKYWNSSTRHYDDGISRHPDEPLSSEYRLQLHREYYHSNTPNDWFHMGEGNQSFYDFGVADPTNPENRRRAIRFAAMYTGDDPHAPNYDPVHRIIRSPFHGSGGPMFHADFERVKQLVDPWYRRRGVEIIGHAQRTNLHPVVTDLEENWYENPVRREEIMKIFDDVILNGDIPESLSATALVTNAFLYTGDDKYRQWVLDYTEAWIDRTRENGGIIPDNVGPTGKIGEQRGGQWWGGLYGWNSRWSGDHALMSASIAAELAMMLTGDRGYLDLIRMPLEKLVDMAKTREDGHLLVPMRITPNGWEEYQTLQVRELAHLYHASEDSRDYDLFTRLREGDKEIDWNDVQPEPDRRSGNSERARFNYYDGRNPDWPMKILSADYEMVSRQHEFMTSDSRTSEQVVAENRWPPNPVIVKGLTQVTMGCPQTIYNGGLLTATVRYFDPDQMRPGLPKNISALVDSLGPNQVGIHLVNLSHSHTRRLIVQAGAFNEHRFTNVTVRSKDGASSTIQVGGGHFAVTLPPSTSICIDAGLSRFVSQPSYKFPWHGDTLPNV